MPSPFFFLLFKIRIYSHIEIYIIVVENKKDMFSSTSTNATMW